MLPPAAYSDNPAMSLCTKHAHASLNKIKHPINVVKVSVGHEIRALNGRTRLMNDVEGQSGRQRVGGCLQGRAVASLLFGMGWGLISRRSCRYVLWVT